MQIKICEDFNDCRLLKILVQWSPPSSSDVYFLSHEKIVVKLMVFCIIIKWSRRGFSVNSFTFISIGIFIEPITNQYLSEKKQPKWKPYKILGCIYRRVIHHLFAVIIYGKAILIFILHKTFMFYFFQLQLLHETDKILANLLRYKVLYDPFV